MLVISESAVLLFLLLRRPTDRISLRPWDWLIAAGGSFVPLLVTTSAPPFLPGVGTALLLAGFVMHVGAKLSLNASFGLVAANRGVKRRGIVPARPASDVCGLHSEPHRLPDRPAGVVERGLYGLELVLQVLRIQAEERVLRDDPSYRSFAEQVRYRLLPGIY